MVSLLFRALGFLGAKVQGSGNFGMGYGLEGLLEGLGLQVRGGIRAGRNILTGRT